MNLEDRMRKLEAQLAAQQRMLRGFLAGAANPTPGPAVRLAKVMGSPTWAAPTEPDTPDGDEQLIYSYPIRFLDVSFQAPTTSHVHSAETTERSSDNAFAGALSGTFFDSGALVFVARNNGLWWIIHRSLGFTFQNNSGETMPAFAVMRILGSINVDAVVETVYDARKPDKFGSQWLHFINGGREVEDGQVGMCFNDWPVPALYDGSDITAGAALGPREDSWLLHAATGGFRFSGRVAGNNIVTVVQDPFVRFRGIARESIGVGQIGDVEITMGSHPGSGYVETGILVPAISPFGAVDENALVICQLEDSLSGDAWRIEMAECSQ